MDQRADRASSFGSVLAVGEFRALWAAQALSVVGDQLARVALSVLVFQRTGSALLTATVYALSFLPWVLGGPLLAGQADRLPRREVMVGCDLARVGIVGLMAVPRVPILALAVLVFLAELFEPPFSAARAALLPDVLPDDRYVTGSAIANVTREAGQLLGFGVGGVLVAVLHPRGALLVDALSFGLSALLLWIGVRHRPAAHLTGGHQPLRHLRDGVALILGTPRLRALVLLAWLCAVYVVPEGLAAPLAALTHGGPVAIGLLLAANPAGTVVGSLLLARLARPSRRLELMLPLAVVAVAPLGLFWLRPALPVMLGLLFLSGIGSAYNLPANAAFVWAVPSRVRGQAFGVVQTGMYVGQGLALAAGGALAQLTTPYAVIAGAGVVGVLAVLVLYTQRAAFQAPAGAVAEAG